MLFWKLLISFLLSAIVGIGYSQTSIIAELKARLEKAASDEEKIQYIFRLCDEKQSMNTEAHRYYVSQAILLSNALNNEYYKDIASAEHAFLLSKDQQTDSALVIVNTLLKKYEKKSNREFITKLLALKGIVLGRGYRNMDMIDAGLSRLQECERYNDTLCMVMTLNSMGWSYLELGRDQDALDWLKRALLLQYSDSAALKKYNCLYSNTALAFHRLGNQDSARHYIEKAIKYARETETLTFLANALSFRAEMLMRTSPAVARASLEEGLAIRKQLGDPYYILYDLIEQARFYAFEKNYAKSIALAREGIVMAYHSGLTIKLPELYKLLADNYEAIGDGEQSIYALKQLVAVTDSLNTVFSNSISDIETKYEVQKKENVIMKQQFDIATKNYFLFGSLLLLLVVIVAAYLILREYKRRHSMKMQVMRDEEKRVAAQAVAEAEEAERKRIAADLHDNLGAQANAILYSTELLQRAKDEKGILVNDLHDTAKDMLTSLRETLWALKNTTVNASDIWLRVINFAGQLGRHYSSVKITTEGKAPPFQLSSTRALNIVFIMQEAMNNAVRHSGAASISVTSECSGDVWTMEVRDNGKGFNKDASNKKPESYGLMNMAGRAEAAGILMSIETGDAKGTKVQLTVQHAD